MAPMKYPAGREAAGDLEESYSLTHLARRWGVSRRDIRQLLQQGELPFIEVLGQIRVPARAVRRHELIDH